MYLFFGVAGLAITGFWAYKRRKANESWAAVGREYNLDYVNGGWVGEYSLTGECRGVDCEVYTETRGSGKSKQKYTIYEVALPDDVPFDLVMYDETLFSKVGKLFGGQDIQVGHQVIDESYIIRGDSPGRIESFFDRDGVAEAVRQLHRGADNINIEYGTASIEETRVQWDRQQLEANLMQLVQFRRDLEEAFEQTELDAVRSNAESEGEASEQFEDHVAEW